FRQLPPGWRSQAPQISHKSTLYESRPALSRGAKDCFPLAGDLSPMRGSYLHSKGCSRMEVPPLGLAKCKFFPASLAWISLTGFRHPITFGHSAQSLVLARQAV